MKIKLLFASLLLSIPAFAQRAGPFNLTAANQCAQISVDSTASSVGKIEVSGTWSATLQPSIAMQGQAASNVGVTSVASAATTQATITANGMYTADVSGADLFQVCASAYTSGSAVVYLTVSKGISTQLFSSGGGSGAVSSVFGRTGAVVAATNDYSFAQISGSPSTTQVPFQSLTTTGSGASSLSGGVLNIPTPTASGTVTSVGTSGLATGGPITSTGTVTVTGSGNTTTAVTAAANVAGATTGNVVTTDGSGNAQSSGTLLSSLAPLASPALTGTPTVPTAAAGTNTTQVSSTAFVNNIFAAPPAIGNTTPAAGSFTTLSASSTVSGTGFSTYLASPPAIGGTAPAGGSFTTLSASSTVSGTGFSTYLASPPAIGGTAAAAATFTNVTTTGLITTPLGSTSAPALQPTGAASNSGVYFPSVNAMGWASGGTGEVAWVQAGTELSATKQVGWSSGSGPTGTVDTTVCRFSGGIVEANSGTGCGSTGALLANQYSNAVTTITASATPAIVATNGLQTITLSANATPTISGIATGQRVTFEVCQPASGGPYTWTWPASIHGGVTIGTTASTCSVQSFDSFSGSTLIAESTGVINVAP